MIPKFHYAASFIEPARHLSATDPMAWSGLTAAIEYLREFKRTAVAPDVKWHIAQSDFAQDCGEIRWPNPENQADHPSTALRGLFIAHPSDEWYVFTMLGNKASGSHRGNAWYEPAVKQSDETARRAIDALKLTPIE